MRERETGLEVIVSTGQTVENVEQRLSCKIGIRPTTSGDGNSTNINDRLMDHPITLY